MENLVRCTLICSGKIPKLYDLIRGVLHATCVNFGQSRTR